MLRENNKVNISGVVDTKPVLSHTVFGEKFYRMYVKTVRKSGYSDVIPVLLSDRMVDINKIQVNGTYYIEGEYRSYNQQIDGRTKLILDVAVSFIEPIDDDCEHIDMVILDGFICKQPGYRTTPKGREISDLLLAVNRPYGKSDYIPCIAWGRNAKYVSEMEIGTRIVVQGRIQSRLYNKQLNDTDYETRVTYEVSVAQVDKVEE